MMDFWLQKFKQYRQSHFIRSVSVLVGGTAFAQVLMVLVLPLLTRLYTPDDLSVLAVYTSLLGIISGAACLRFDITIPMPEQDQDAANLLGMALGIAAIISMIVALSVFFFSEEVVHLVGQPQLQPYLWLLPVGVFFSASYSALQFWFTRKKDFPAIARTRIGQAIGGSGTQVAFGLLGFTPLGLILGQMISSGAGAVSLGFRALKLDYILFKKMTRADIRRLFYEYDRFPKYSTIEVLVNSAGIHLAVIMIAALAVGPEAGFFFLALRVMQAPLALVGAATAQVYLSRAPEEQRTGNLGSFTAKLLNGLLKTGVGPLIFLGVVGPDAFSVIFGEKWRHAGELVVWMIPWVVIQFLGSPISMVLHVQGAQNIALMLNLYGIVIRLLPLPILAYLGHSNYLVQMFSLTSALFYIGWLFFGLKYSSAYKYPIIDRTALLIIGCWMMSSFSLQYILHGS